MSKKLLFISLLFSQVLLFGEYEDAQELFNDAACMDCHNNEDFVAKKGKITDFKKLCNIVDACRFSNDADWFDDESLNVSEYLNYKFYKFKK
ncbi:hypothetical protein JHD46_06355 [Sulfurimonas sp. SAG-AH-194-C20]|nr:hypothetical protein [Sulfurimonas sp. SAG-AH-194-C20]MDF1879259.1 hypothetical protein [Sulfurimonas sp. SAG-AH-194-C20]